jgi:transcriptional regulator with XRE-family HTH domain
MATREEIGRRIREAREELDLSQTDLGRLLTRQRTHAAVSELERGKVRLDAEELVELAAILKKDVAYFYDAPAAPSIVYRRGGRGLAPDHQRQTDRAIEAFKQYAREQAKLDAKRQGQ